MFLWVGKEAGDDFIVICHCIDRAASVLAELRLYWPSCGCIGRVCCSYDSDHFCHIDTVLVIVS